MIKMGINNMQINVPLKKACTEMQGNIVIWRNMRWLYFFFIYRWNGKSSEIHTHNYKI